MWPNPLETAGLITFTEKILNGKLHFLCGECFVPWFSGSYSQVFLTHFMPPERKLTKNLKLMQNSKKANASYGVKL